MGMVMVKWTSKEQPTDVGFWASRASSRALGLAWQKMQASHHLGQPLS